MHHFLSSKKKHPNSKFHAQVVRSTLSASIPPSLTSTLHVPLTPPIKPSYTHRSSNLTRSLSDSSITLSISSSIFLDLDDLIIPNASSDLPGLISPRISRPSSRASSPGPSIDSFHKHHKPPTVLDTLAHVSQFINEDEDSDSLDDDYSESDTIDSDEEEDSNDPSQDSDEDESVIICVVEDVEE